MPGSFFSGVPGVLAAMENGRLAPGAIVERCDQCRRFPTDAAALARLQELGLAGGDLGGYRAFNVECYALVRVRFTEVLATDPRSAARQAHDRFDWETHGKGAEYADEIAQILVESKSNADRAETHRFRPNLELIDR